MAALDAVALAADPVPAADADAIPWRTVSLLSLGAFASSGMTRVLDPMLPRLQQDFGVSLGHAAWSVTAFATAYGLMQLFYGPLADRRGKLRVMSVAAALAAAAALACVLAKGSLVAFVVARVAAGAFCAASIPLAMAWIGDAIPYERRQPVLARFMIGQMVGMASGQMLGGSPRSRRSGPGHSCSMPQYLCWSPRCLRSSVNPRVIER